MKKRLFLILSILAFGLFFVPNVANADYTYDDATNNISYSVAEDGSSAVITAFDATKTEFVITATIAPENSNHRAVPVIAIGSKDGLSYALSSGTAAVTAFSNKGTTANVIPADIQIGKISTKYDVTAIGLEDDTVTCPEEAFTVDVTNATNLTAITTMFLSNKYLSLSLTKGDISYALKKDGDATVAAVTAFGNKGTTANVIPAYIQIGKTSTEYYVTAIGLTVGGVTCPTCEESETFTVDATDARELKEINDNEFFDNTNLIFIFKNNTNSSGPYEYKGGNFDKKNDYYVVSGTIMDSVSIFYSNFDSFGKQFFVPGINLMTMSDFGIVVWICSDDDSRLPLLINDKLYTYPVVLFINNYFGVSYYVLPFLMESSIKFPINSIFISVAFDASLFDDTFSPAESITDSLKHPVMPKLEFTWINSDGLNVGTLTAVTSCIIKSKFNNLTLFDASSLSAISLVDDLTFDFDDVPPQEAHILHAFDGVVLADTFLSSNNEPKCSILGLINNGNAVIPQKFKISNYKVSDYSLGLSDGESFAMSNTGTIDLTDLGELTTDKLSFNNLTKFFEGLNKDFSVIFEGEDGVIYEYFPNATTPLMRVVGLTETITDEDDNEVNNTTLKPAVVATFLDEQNHTKPVTELGNGKNSIGTHIKKFVFSNDTKLTTINPYAFKDCVELTELEIPATVTEICGNSFAGCTALTDLSFWGTPNDFKYAVSEDTQKIVTADEGKTLVWYLDSNTGTSYTVPDTIKTIAENGAFTYGSELTEVILSDSVNDVSVTAFNFDGTVSLPDPDAWKADKTIVLTRTTQDLVYAETLTGGAHSGTETETDITPTSAEIYTIEKFDDSAETGYSLKLKFRENAFVHPDDFRVSVNGKEIEFPTPESGVYTFTLPLDAQKNNVNIEARYDAADIGKFIP